MLNYSSNLLATNNCQVLSFSLPGLQSSQMRVSETGPSAWQTMLAGWLVADSAQGLEKAGVTQGHSCASPHPRSDQWINCHCDVLDHRSPYLLLESMAKTGVSPLSS